MQTGRARLAPGYLSDPTRKTGGVRTTADFEFEMQLADVNRQLTGIETILLPASPQFASLTSSVVRELAHFGRDISAFLP